MEKRFMPSAVLSEPTVPDGVGREHRITDEADAVDTQQVRAVHCCRDAKHLQPLREALVSRFVSSVAWASVSASDGVRGA